MRPGLNEVIYCQWQDIITSDIHVIKCSVKVHVYNFQSNRKVTFIMFGSQFMINIVYDY